MERLRVWLVTFLACTIARLSAPAEWAPAPRKLEPRLLCAPSLLAAAVALM